MAVNGRTDRMPTRGRLRWLLAAAVFALPVVTFLPILEHSWLNYDDNVYITQSAPVLAGITRDSLAWAFSSFDGANWFPLTRLSWMLDTEIHGTNASGFLATNLILHALASLAFFAAFTQLTGNALRSAFIAAVFAVHPLHVESVAWIAARKDPLSALFFALALLAYARNHLAGHGARGRLLVFLLMACGLMAKPIVVSLPFVLLLLDFWPLRRLDDGTAHDRIDPRRVRAVILEKSELFVLAAGFSILTLIAQDSGGAVASLEQIAPFDRVANALNAYAAYVGLALWPRGLAIFYPHVVGDLPAARVALAGALFLALGVAAWLQRNARPYFAVGWFWYVGTLVPVIGLVQVGSQAMADRYTYLPLVGLGIAAAWGVSEACARLPGRRFALPALGLALITAWSAATAVQIRHWRDSETLFRHALAVTQRNHVAHSYLGAALLEQGRTAEAIAEFGNALALRDDLLTVSNNLGWLLATHPDPSFRDPAKAVEVSENAVALTERADPSVLDTLAAAYASAGRYADAVRAAERAIEIARSHGDEALAADIATRLALFRTRRAYVDPAP